MAPVDVNDPKVIRFLKETYEKTARLRMLWNERHLEKLKETAAFRGKEKGYTIFDVEKAKVEGGLSTIIRDHKAAARNRIKTLSLEGPENDIGVADMRKGHSIPEVGLGDVKDDPRLARPDSNLNPDPVMRPVAPELRDLLRVGSQAYLKARYQKAPEEKYYFPESEGWVYGWRMKDSKQLMKYRYGRICPLTIGCMNRTGATPDPTYYKSSILPSYKPMMCE